MEVLFISSTAVITKDPEDTKSRYVDALGLPLEPVGDGYWRSEEIEGSKHFGVWPLAHAAQSCFGTEEWPADRVVPQASVEVEVASAELVSAAEAELVDAGWDRLHAAKEEPWGQTVARFQTPEGAIVGVSYAPWFHQDASAG
jgi:catechol 2,3-dioxygenase-like lactoylglutathione lyase family enzyme